MTTKGAPISLLLVALVTASLLPFRSATPEGDALFAMMQKWNVVLPGWVPGGDPCSPTGPPWSKVSCRNGFVVELNVTNTGITGSLPSEIGSLQYLEVLDVSNVYNVMSETNNSLDGAFPDSLAQCTLLKSFNASNINWNIEFPTVLTKLTALEELYFSSASLSGTIPDDFYNNLVNLRSLYLGNNNLQGSLQKLANLKRLVLVTVFQNDFTGTLPVELGNLVNLQYFNCHTCNLYGGLPDSFSQLSNLQNLTLHRNNFTGTIPDSWNQMTNMQNLRMDQNYISGPFPSWMFTDWPSLNYLYLTKNSFYGPTPNVTDLDVKYNVSYTFSILKWDCNYLKGLEPCSDTNNCSAQIDSKINDANKDFDFDKNCYSDSSAKELAQVPTSCDVYHPTDQSCTEFYALTSTPGGCPRCPSNQVRWPEAGQCVCRLSGSSSSGGVPVGAVVGGVLGLLAVFAVVIALLLYKRRKHFSFLDIFTVKRHTAECWEAPPGVERFSLQDLAKVTQDFSEANVIGQGGFGKVFVGTLPDGRMVAIKRAPAVRQYENAEFHNEVTLLSRLHHRNLVKLEGFCDDEGLQILVYEFVKNGNLHAHLLGKLTTTPLQWYRRLEIAYGVAQGLEYLHSFADPPVIHRDVKPSNILLDDHMVAKVADFGISKVSPEYDTHVSTRPAGTAGYLDPDYFMRRQLTTASDVYAYGVVLLELVTGQEAIDHTRLEEFNLIEWVRKRFKTAGIVSIIDPLIENDYSPEAYSEMAKLGLRCASFDRQERPTMKVVLSILEPFLVMQSLYPKVDLDERDGTKPLIAFETEYLGVNKQPRHTGRSTETSHTDRSTESNPSEIGRDMESLSGLLKPR